MDLCGENRGMIFEKGKEIDLKSLSEKLQVTLS